MKKIISIVTAVAMVTTLSTTVAFAGQGHDSDSGKNSGKSTNQTKQVKEFKDMKGHWGYNSVNKMQEYGIFNGYDDGTFKPDNTLSDAELAVLIERIVDYKLDEDAEDDDDEALSGGDGNDWGAGYNWGSWGSWGTWNNPYFKNVPGWAQKAVWKGAYSNYFDPNTFNPSVKTTRVSATVAIAKAIGLEPVLVYTYNPFSDSKLIADEDLGYILAMYQEGYISGFPNGNFNPNAALSRAQMASIIEKLLEDGIDLGDDVDSDDEEAPTWDEDSEIEAVEIGDTSVSLKWTAAEDDEDVTGYKVIYKVNDKDKSKEVTATKATISGLEPDTEYTFTVEARDAAGNWSDDGPSVEIITLEEDEVDDEEDTEEPYWSSSAYLSASDVTANSVTLKWSGAKDDVAVTEYVVSYELDGDDVEKKVTGKTLMVTGLEADVEYTFTVEAKDAAGNISTDGPSIDVTTDEEADDEAPTWGSSPLTVSSSSTGVTLIWDDAEDNAGIESYKIYQDNVLIETVDGDVNSYIITGLEDGETYKFTVKAVDEAGNSASTSETYTND